MNILWTALALSLVSTSIQAEECNAELKKDDRYQDLNAILSCFAKKVTTLEAEIKALQTSKVPVPDSLNKSALLQDNSYFSIYASGFSITDTEINFGLNINNKTNKEIYLAWESTQLIITDGNGLSASYERTTMPVLNRGDARPTVYTLIGPGAMKPVSVSFKHDNIKGSKKIGGVPQLS